MLHKKPLTRSKQWLARGAAVAAVAMAVASATVAVGSTEASADGGYQAPIVSGNAWPTGAYQQDHNADAADTFAEYRGRPLDVVMDWPERAHWNDFILPNRAYTNHENKPYTTVLGIPMIPSDDPDATMAGCGNGDYASQWQTFAHTIQDAGLGSSIIRLGWEMNGYWYPWGGDRYGADEKGHAAAYKACFRKIVNTVRPIAPNLKYDWTVNRNSSEGLPDRQYVQAAYPGDSYVDIVGIDNYDNYTDWNGQLGDSTSQGLNDWLAFAIAHGKKLSVPEWNVFTPAKGGFGDDPDYIQHMYDFFTANASNIAYESVYSYHGDDGDDSLWNPVTMPQSSAEYHELYHSPSADVLSVIEDTAVGTSPGTVQFSSNWSPCIGDSSCHNGSDGNYKWTATTGATATVRFTGHRFKWFGMKEPVSNIATVSIDGGNPVNVDPYSPDATGSALLYTSPVLDEGDHTAVITMTGAHNPNNNSGASITFDHVDVLSAPATVTTTIEDDQTGNSLGTVDYSDGWTPCDPDTCWKGSSLGYLWTATVGATATVRFTGHQITWYGLKEPVSDIATVSIDGGDPVDVDPYSSAATGGLPLYTSPVLDEGDHTAVITMTGRKNPGNTTGASLTFDRAEVLSWG